MTYIRLAEPPRFVYQAPTCSACSVQLISEDGLICPCCGSSWPYDASDDDEGTLYTEWSGEEAEGELVPNEEAYRKGFDFEREQRKGFFVSLGWCEHGMPGRCAVVGCPGGAEAPK